MTLPFWLRWWFRAHFFRTRRKCPDCGAIGTFKAFARIPDLQSSHVTPVPNRLLCKWCGYYENEFQILQEHACTITKSWQLPSYLHGSVCDGPPNCERFTPREILMSPFAGRPAHWPLANPWTG